MCGCVCVLLCVERECVCVCVCVWRERGRVCVCEYDGDECECDYMREEGKGGKGREGAEEISSTLSEATDESGSFALRCAPWGPAALWGQRNQET